MENQIQEYQAPEVKSKLSKNERLKIIDDVLTYSNTIATDLLSLIVTLQDDLLRYYLDELGSQIPADVRGKLYAVRILAEGIYEAQAEKH